MRLLVTRPEPDAQHTAAALRARGHDVLATPLLRYQPIANADLGEGPWAGVLMTSVNAARAVAQHPRRDELRGLAVLAVGGRTAQAARDAGFGIVESADGAAGDLVGLAAAQFAGTAAPLIHLAAEDLAADPAGALAAHGVLVRTVVLYRMVAAQALPGAVAAALSARRIDAVLHYSQRSAETYLRCAETAGLGAAAVLPAHYCLSADIATRLAEAGAGTLHVAKRPDERSLLELIGSA